MAGDGESISGENPIFATSRPSRASASRGASSSDAGRCIPPLPCSTTGDQGSALKGASLDSRADRDGSSERSASRGASSGRATAGRPSVAVPTYPASSSSGPSGVPVVMLPEAIAHRDREKITLPAFPTVATLRNWKLEVASILVAHSAFLDSKEMEWVQESWKPGQTF